MTFTSGTTPQPLAELLEEIDAEISSLRERLHILCKKRNHLSPIYRLPPEIFTRIFSHFQDDVIDDADVEEQEKYAEWIIILQVTQYWRELALGSKGLWSNIAAVDRRWIDKAYELSGINNLSIKFDMTTPMASDLFRSATKEPHRISSISLIANSSTWEEIATLLKFPAPNLKVLELKTSMRNGWEIAGALSPDIFGGEFPQLRSLFVHSFHISLDTPLFRALNLTYLAIKLPKDFISITDMIRHLQRLPQLRSLSLVEALTCQGVPHNFNPVHLPSLTFLELEDVGLQNNIEFLRRITLPESTSLRVESFEIPTSLEPIDFFGDVMDSLTKTFQNPNLEFRDLNIGWHSHIFLDSPKSPGQRLASGSPSPPFVRLEFGFEDESALTHDYIARWLLRLPKSFLTPVEVLHFQSDQVLSVDNWLTLAHNLPNLRHLKLGNCVTSFMAHLSSLSSEIDMRMDVESNSLPAPVKDDLVYPALRRLTLPLSLVEDADILYKYLASRQREGLEMEQVNIRIDDDPLLRDQILNVLQGTAKEISWD